MSDRQDRVIARTPAQLNQQFNFGKSFAEVMGVATGAQKNAEEAEKKTEKLDEDLTADEIFNRLTDNGNVQGIYKQNGQIYINANYIRAIEDLFAKDINMSGTFTHTVEAFLQPGEPEVEAIRQTLLVSNPAPYNALFDFNSDGVIDAVDLVVCRKAMLGLLDLSTWDKAVKKPVTMKIDLKNPEKAITFSGVNMWGREVTEYIGINDASIVNYGVKQKLDALSKAHIPTVVDSDGANVGYDIGLGNTVGLVMVKDINNPFYYWYGIYGFTPGTSHTLQKISSNGLTVTFADEWGTILLNGSGSYKFYNVTQGIL